MSFASQLQTAKGDLTARQVAAAVSPLLSVRTVEDWLADRRSPPAWTPPKIPITGKAIKARLSLSP